MKNEYIPYISGFSDFCEYHADGKPIYISHDRLSNRLVAGFDLASSISSRYIFTTPFTQMEIERAIFANMYMFDVEESNLFYYPNTNMFSHSNAVTGLHGFILRLKGKYVGKPNRDRKMEDYEW